jgi:hypothetical protein
MAKLTVTDAFGLEATGQLRQGTKLAQILPQFLSVQTLPLDQVKFQQGQAGFVFDKPIDVSAAGLTFEIGVSGGGGLAVLKPEDHVLNYDDVFEDVAIKPDEVYLAFDLTLSRKLGVSATVDSVTFGLSSERDITITNYRRFQSEGGTFPTFLKALGETANCFMLPLERKDLESLDENTVLAIAGNGQVRVSGGFEIQLSTRQLAVSSPIAGTPIAVNTSGSAGIRLDFTIKGGYKIRVRRLTGQTIELSVYRLASKELGLSVKAEAGIAAMRGTSDLAENFIKALSRQPVVDIKEFQQALPGDDPTARDRQINTFQEDLANAVSTKVEASVAARLSDTKSDEAVWQFEIDLAAATSDAADSAITSALRGDFRPLTCDPSLLPAGIKQTADIFKRTDLKTHRLQVNLLGILNFFAVDKMTLVAAIQRNAADEITLVTDSSDDYRLHVLLLNAGGKAQRLRGLLNEDFLIQASYKVADLRVLPPEFSAKHSYVELNDKTDSRKMKDILDVVKVAGLLTEQAEGARLQNRGDFGRTTFFIGANYSSAEVERIFLDSAGMPRGTDDYETQGRMALAALLAGDDGQPFRKLISDTGPKGNAVWERLRNSGNPAQFNEFFGVSDDQLDPNVAAAGSDFLCITFWAAAMNEAGKAIREVKDLLAGAIQIDDSLLAQARQHLTMRMADVVKNSQEHFGDPLGLVMVYFCSGKSAEMKAVVSGDAIERLAVSSPPSAISAASGN